MLNIADWHQRAGFFPPSRRLDLDDLRAEEAEHKRGIRTIDHMGEIENTNII